MKRDADGRPYVFQAVVECSDEPVAGEWLVKLACGHRAAIRDMAHADCGAPLGMRCTTCEEAVE